MRFALPRLRSIRSKLTLAALTPLLAAMAVISFLGFYLINAWVVGEAQKKVRNDLEAARAEFLHEKNSLLDSLHFIVNNLSLRGALAQKDLPALVRQVGEVQVREQLDLLTLTDSDGRVLVYGGNPAAGGGPVNDSAYVRSALAGNIFSGTLLLPRSQLLRENPAAAARAVIPLAPAAKNGRGATETRGMVVLGAYPITADDGRMLGCLYGGILLNRNLDLVDRIKHIVYGDEVYGERSLGSATIFLDDVRIATTVRLPGGERALGTMMSREVAQTVLAEKEIWLDRALVVDDWYLTAYEPIIDGGGKAIGSLYVGLLEAPYKDLRREAALVLLLVLLGASALGYLLAHFGARHFSQPIRNLVEMTQRVARGERRIPLPVTSGDELGRLTEAFNHMSDSLHQREDELQTLNRELEDKVRERTRMLEEKSQELLKTQEELARSEKLAAIGALAAGVAHEINNPTAIIRGNTELLLMELGSDQPGREEAEEVKKQTERIARITENLVTFARRQIVHRDEVDINALLAEILSQLGHQVPMTEITVKRNFAPDLPLFSGDAGHLRQVFTNILLNAVEAMEEGGILVAATEVRDGCLRVEITDTGAGVSPDVLEKLFNPFFTTKRRGTGLGLSVSYGIVERHGGEIVVHSEPGKGATFIVSLPLVRRAN